MLGKTARTVSLAISRGQLVHIKKVRACSHSLQSFERRVLTSRHRASPITLELPREKSAQTLARFFIVLRDRFRSFVQKLRVIAAQPHRCVFCPEPTRPVPRLERFEFISARNRID